MARRVGLVFLLLISGQFFLQVSSQCQISILGNDGPLIAGIQKDITCVYNCQNVATIQWLLVVGSFAPIYKSSSNATELVLDLNPTLGDNGSRFRCRVMDNFGNMYVEIIITVEELAHTLNVTASQENPVLAGSRLTLTCLAVASRPVTLQWQDADGYPINSTSSITVSSPTVSGHETTITLTFNAIKTSDSLNYICYCEIDSPASVNTTNYHVYVQIPAPTVYVRSNPSSFLSTCIPVIILCSATVSHFVDTSIDVNITWSDRATLRDNSRVTVTSPSGPPYESSVSISSLMSRDTGSYQCCVQLHSSQSPGVVNSRTTCRSIAISAGLSVSIEVDYEAPCDYEFPRPYYRPCTPISLSCEVCGASGQTDYSWTTNSASFLYGSTNKTVSTDMLTYHDSGLHKCCAVDQAGNRGCAKTEIFIKGHGLYVDDSEYISGAAVSNNTIVVSKASRCTNCKLDVYCCTDRRSASMEFMFPNGVSKAMANDYLNINVEQTRNEGRIRLYNHLSDNPLLYGLYCCKIDGSPVQLSSIAVYSSLPDPPRVYSSSYEYIDDTELDYIIIITCSTSDSPATKVEWCRNGEPIEMDGVNYTSLQHVTDKRNLYYDNILYVKSPCLAAGTQQFECKINNSQGSDSHVVETNVPVYNVTEITSEGSGYAGDQLVLNCFATLPMKLKNLLRHLRMEWTGPPGVQLTRENSVIIGRVNYHEFGLSRTLTFNPLKTEHSGLYSCHITIFGKDDLAQFFLRQIRHDIPVVTRALFQLQFGPICDGCIWSTHQDSFSVLEANLKKAIVDAINERCHCDFHRSLIDMGEISFLGNSAVYRARLTATIYTAEQLLAMLQDWINTQGTFLFTLHGRTRLRVNPNCLPMVISSFSDPECGLSVAEVNSILFSVAE